MHAVDVFIVIAIGQVVGWLATIYGETDHRRLGVNLIISTVGAFIGGYLSLVIVSEHAKFSMIFIAFVVSISLLIVSRFRWSKTADRHGLENPSNAKWSRKMEVYWSEISFRQHMPSILFALIVVTGIFLLLGWLKTNEIRDPKANLGPMNTAHWAQTLST